MILSLGGSFVIGQNVEYGYFDQQIAVIDGTNPNQTVLENFGEGYPKLKRGEVRSALGSFLLSGEEVEKLIGQLSGGEKVNELRLRLVDPALASDYQTLMELQANFYKITKEY